MQPRGRAGDAARLPDRAGAARGRSRRLAAVVQPHVQHLGAVNWPHVRAFVDEIVTVSEDAIRDAMRGIATGARLVAEPSGAVALAGLLTMAPTERDVAILSGGNVDLGLYAATLAGR